MKIFAILALALAAVGAQAQTVYGTLTIRDGEEVRVYNGTPSYVYRSNSQLSPLYVYAPYEHRSDWARHCDAYGACYRPVYFVSDDWYREHRGHAYRYEAPAPVYQAPSNDNALGAAIAGGVLGAVIGGAISNDNDDHRHRNWNQRNHRDNRDWNRRDHRDHRDHRGPREHRHDRDGRR